LRNQELDGYRWSIRSLLLPGTTTCGTQELQRPFHDSEIGHQRCHTICSASSGTEALR
jgi:hypothetical protein